WLPIPGSIDAIAKLSQAGYQVAVCTNQSGLARHYFQLADLDAMHQKMRTLVEQAGGTIAGIYYCPHLPDAHCDCRKPLPGLIDQAAAELGVSAKGAAFVGDSLKDLQAALARDCLPVLVKTGKGPATLERLSEHSSLSATPVFDNLAAFVECYLNDRTST
ncbi:MAG: D-glycero-D-manno-heptose 1,7-bisphosphate phosphatase, partial [Bacteroidia bacterium]